MSKAVLKRRAGGVKTVRAVWAAVALWPVHVQMYGMCTEHTSMCTAFVSYFCGMTATRQNRTARAYTFTFDSEAEKEAAHAHAKRRGTNLANLLKMLLASDIAANTAPASSRE